MALPLVDTDVLERVLNVAGGFGEFAEVFVEDRQTSSASLDQGRVEELSNGRDRGAGIRVVVGETTGFAHTADLSEAGLLAAARAAATIAREGGGGVRQVALGPVADHRSAARTDPREVDKAAKNLPPQETPPEGATLLPASETTAREEAPRDSRREAEREAEEMFAKLKSMTGPDTSEEE